MRPRGTATWSSERAERLHASPVDAAADRLEGVLEPEHPLGEVDGIAVVVMLVELWTSRLMLRLEAQRNQLTDALDETYDTEWKAFEGIWVERRGGKEIEEDYDPRPPEQASVSRLNGLPLSVTDDVGTRYHVIATATGGSEHPWRSVWRLEPAVPPSANMLRIALEGGEREWQSLELALPSRIAEDNQPGGRPQFG